MAKGTTANYRTNEQIRLPQVRLIDENNNQVGVVDTYEALRRAREAGMDLVEVARNERPPVCRIMDYGKFKYHMKKKTRKHHEQQLKEVRLRPKTDYNDRVIKINRALKFLAKGDKVQFTMQFRGRERAHRELGIVIFRAIIDDLNELIRVERSPGMDGRNLIMILSANKPAFDKLIAAGKKLTLEDIVGENKIRAEAVAAAALLDRAAQTGELEDGEPEEDEEAETEEEEEEEELVE